MASALTFVLALALALALAPALGLAEASPRALALAAALTLALDEWPSTSRPLMWRASSHRWTTNCLGLADSQHVDY